MNRRVFAGALTASALLPVAEPRLVDCRRIWDAAPHNAFTDLIRYRKNWYCSFREGAGHVSPDGKLRVLRSRDGVRWESAASIESSLGDLRDAHLAETPNGELMLYTAVALKDPEPDLRHQSLAWFSRDGSRWTEPILIGDRGFWLWRITWHKKVAIGFGYGTQTNRNLRLLRLYRTVDGRRFETLLPNAGVPNSPGETAIRFRKNGTAITLLRRDPYKGEPPIPPEAATGMVGIARPLYTSWEWKDLKVQIGGPNFIEVPGNHYVAAVRLYQPQVRTGLCWLDPDRGSLEELLTLPSRGDTSYAGLVWHKNQLWTSYYSTHEQKTSVYLARVSL